MIEDTSQEPRRRGRPVGTGRHMKEDPPILRRAADLIAAGDVRRPTDAFRRLLPTAGDSAIRRLQGKWREDKETLLADARRRREERERAARARPDGACPAPLALSLAHAAAIHRGLNAGPLAAVMRQMAEARQNLAHAVNAIPPETVAAFARQAAESHRVAAEIMRHMAPVQERAAEIARQLAPIQGRVAEYARLTETLLGSPEARRLADGAVRAARLFGPQPGQGVP